VQRKEWLRVGVVPDDYPDPVATEYPDCLRIVEEKVKPERDRNKRKVRRERWWQFAERAPDLYATIAGMDRVFAIAATSRTLAIAWAPSSIVFSHATYVFAFDRPGVFALLQSMAHDAWARVHGSSMRTDLRYTPSDCFETYPFPVSTSALDPIGERYNEHRRTVARTRNEGLTRIYNRFSDPKESAPDIVLLRELHVEMDSQVASSYGWTDLDLGHDCHQTKQGVRFTISEPARQEVLARLLRLNHERYQDEVRRGLHDKKGRRGLSEMEDSADDLFTAGAEESEP
jgi:hypothetical protein